MFVDHIVDKISEVAVTLAFRHICYLCHYNENIRDLQDETEKLQWTLIRIHDEIVGALRNSEDIEPDAEKWRNDATEMVDKVVTFLQDKVRSKTRFVKCLCWNPRLHYRLSKESTLMRARVGSLNDHGAMFLTLLPLSHPALPPESLEDLDSRKEILDGILEALNDPTIKMIGVHGAGGTGKTKMVRDIRNQAKRDKLFDDVAFAVVSQKLDKEKVQGELAAQLGLDLGLNDYGRAEKLSTRLQNGKKNLVILDDVWDPVNLEEIGIPTTTDYGNKPGCCKVLITSRKNLFHTMAPKACPKVFLIPILEKTEAWTLFVRKAEISVIDIAKEMLSIAEEVCRECAGLPIAIVAVATTLKGKEEYAWNNALAQLKRSNFNQIEGIDPNLFFSLRLSYEFLKLDGERSLFLLCSLFPEDAEIPIEDLVRYSFGMRLLGSNMSTKLEDVRNKVLTVVKSLKASCLLLDCEEDDNTVKMHDVIRDVAIIIVNCEKKHLVKHNLKSWGGPYEGYLAISLMSEHFGHIPSELGCKELHTLVLRSKDYLLPDSFFNGMESNLEVLDLSGMVNIEILPFSLSKLVKLRMLFLPDRVRDISLLKELKSLEILCAKGIYELPLEIRQLTRLKLLDLGNFSTSLTVIPPNVLCNLTSMEELCIPDAYDKWQDESTNEEERRNASLVELNSLTSLTTLKVHIPEGKSSLNLLCFEKLDRFRISIDAHLDCRSFVTHERILRLSNVPLEDKFKVLMLNSQVLDLKKVQGLEEVLHHMDGSGLKYLRVTECDDGEHLLGRLEQSLKTTQEKMSRSFDNLSTLSVEKCTFNYLFNISVARCLEHLQGLFVSHCSNMEVIVGKERQGDYEEITFPRLKYISLGGLPNLQSLCASKRLDSITVVSSSKPAQPLFCEKVVVPVLENLSIIDLDNIPGIWDKQFIKEGTGSFNQLRSLYVRSCPRLVNVVLSNIDGANDEPFLFPKLWHMQLSDLAGLERFCNSSGHEESLFNQKVVFPRLDELRIQSLRSLKRIWDRTPPANSFQQLSLLLLMDCQNLLYVAPSEVLGSLQNLERLWISSCNLLEAVFKSRGSESEEGKVVEHEITTEEVDAKVVLPRLRNLVLYDLPRLKSFCAGSKLPSSADRNIKECPHLEQDF